MNEASLDLIVQATVPLCVARKEQFLLSSRKWFEGFALPQPPTCLLCGAG